VAAPILLLAVMAWGFPGFTPAAYAPRTCFGVRYDGDYLKQQPGQIPSEMLWLAGPYLKVGNKRHPGLSGNIEIRQAGIADGDILGNGGHCQARGWTLECVFADGSGNYRVTAGDADEIVVHVGTMTLKQSGYYDPPETARLDGKPPNDAFVLKRIDCCDIYGLRATLKCPLTRTAPWP
jgi:hypothetical protein